MWKLSPELDGWLHRLIVNNIFPHIYTYLCIYVSTYEYVCMKIYLPKLLELDRTTPKASQKTH